MTPGGTPDTLCPPSPILLCPSQGPPFLLPLGYPPLCWPGLGNENTEVITTTGREQYSLSGGPWFGGDGQEQPVCRNGLPRSSSGAANASELL